MSRYLEIYSSHRDRTEYPSVSQFSIPFTVAADQRDDPILQSAIYYTWSGLSADSLANTGNVNSNSYDFAVAILPQLSIAPSVANALAGLQLTIQNPVLTSDQYGAGSTNSSPVLGPSASSVDNVYVGNTLTDVSTLEMRTITGYNGTTKTVTLDSPFTGTILAAGDGFITSYDGGQTWIGGVNAGEAIVYGGTYATMAGMWQQIEVGVFLSSSPLAAPNFFSAIQGGSLYVTTQPSSLNGYAVAYGGLWVVVGTPYPASGGSYTMATSSDAQNWTYSSVFDQGGYAVAWNGTRWVAMGASVNSIVFSNDGMTWTGLGNSIFSTGKGVVWTGGKWYGVGTGPYTIASSFDGVTWTGISTSLFSTANAIAYGNGVLVAVGVGSNTIAYSTDGVNWTGLGKILRNSGNAVAWTGGLFVVTGNDYALSGNVASIWTSPDGVTWTSADSSRYLMTGYSIQVNPTQIVQGKRYQIGGASQSRLVVGYDPSSATCVPQTAFDGVVTNLRYTLTDPSTRYVIHLPYQDVNGNNILTIEQAYNGYYIIDETLSSGSQTVVRQIIYYDNQTRLAYLDQPFPEEWSLSDLYTLRREIPSETLTLTTDRIPYLNTNPLYGPIGPVIPFPATASSTDSYYTGRYVYYSSLPSFNQAARGQFQPVYGNYLIKSYKGSTREAFVEYSTTVSTPYYNMPYPYVLLTTQVQAGSGSDVVNINQTTASTIPGFYRGYQVTVQETGETRYIVDYDGFDSLLLNAPLTKPIQVGFTCTIHQTGQINIVSYRANNAQSLQYSGGMVSQSETVCYHMALVVLTVPNVPLRTGGRITDYPFLYVKISNETSPNRAAPALIYSNNPGSRQAVFMAPVTEIVEPTTDLFIKLGNPSMVQTVKFKPNDNLSFSIFLPNGELFQTVQNDFTTPYPANPLLQVHATFFLRRL